VQDMHRHVRIGALGRDRASLRVLVEREDGLFETVEPLGALLGRPGSHPEVQFLIGLPVFRMRESRSTVLRLKSLYLGSEGAAGVE